MIKVGSGDIGKLYVGSTEIAKAYVGSQLVYENSVVPLLPYDAKIEYLQCSGTQMINTSIDLAAETTSVKLVFKASFSTTYVDNTLMVASSDPNLGVQVYTQSGNTIYNQGAYKRITLNTAYTFTTVTTSSARSIQLDNGSVTSRTFNRSISDGARLYLLNYPSFVSTNRGARGTYYSFDVYINDVIVREYIPVRVGTIGYLYDKVSGELFGNSGTGDFILGPDIN